MHIITIITNITIISSKNNISNISIKSNSNSICVIIITSSSSSSTNINISITISITISVIELLLSALLFAAAQSDKNFS